MTIPHYVNEGQSDIRAIKPGWYGIESNGKLSSGPFSNREKCITGIMHRGASFEHRRGQGPLSVPSVEAKTSGPTLPWMNVAANGSTTVARPAGTHSASQR